MKVDITEDMIRKVVETKLADVVAYTDIFDNEAMSNEVYDAMRPMVKEILIELKPAIREKLIKEIAEALDSVVEDIVKGL